MTARSQKPTPGRVPLATLLARARDITVEQLHLQLAEEGFTGLRFRHGAVFRFIGPEGARLTALAEQSGLSKQAIGEVVDELERLGYVERTADPADRRAKLILLTERGSAGQLAAGRILGDMEHQWAEQVGHEEIAVLRRSLEGVVAQHAK